MRLCFINPPVEDFYYTSARSQPIGLLYVVAACKKAGHEVSLINCVTGKKKPVRVPAQFSYLEKFINHSDEKYRFPFKEYHRFGLGYDEIRKRIKETDAEAFCVSSSFTTYHEEVEKIIGIIKREKKGTPVIAGGYHASLYPEHFLKNLDTDYVIFSEGEIGMVELLVYLGGEMNIDAVSNLVHESQGRVISNESRLSESIDQFDPPAREYLKKSDFTFYGKRGTSLVASRGCPNGCSFCTSREMWKTHRRRSAENIVQEMRRCLLEFGVSWFNFEDDNLFPDRKSAMDLLQPLIEFRNSRRDEIEFTAMNGLSAECLDEEIFVLMKRAGFREINISLATKSAELQSRLKRPFDTEKFRQIVAWAKRHGLAPRAYFILGLPEQTKEEIEDTISFLSSLNIKFFPSVYYNVKSPPDEWKTQRSSAFFNETEHLSREDLLYYFNYSRKILSEKL